MEMNDKYDSEVHHKKEKKMCARTCTHTYTRRETYTGQGKISKPIKCYPSHRKPYCS